MAMKAKASRKQRDYPVTSRTIRAAEKARKMVDALSEAEVEELFRQGMVRIYGEQPKAPALAGHKRPS
ncbi:MAG: hypothetical protein HYY24_07825 [Verrucomicrobia bacterium]|nr:hypothetical protein [Verrucomicrobiota bacterium]